MTETDADAATDKASSNAINTDPHGSNSSTALEDANANAENNTSVRQLLDSQ